MEGERTKEIGQQDNSIACFDCYNNNNNNNNDNDNNFFLLLSF